MWEALGLHFGTLGLQFGVILEALAPLGAHFGHFVGIYQKMKPFRRESGVHFGTLLGPKSINISKKV